MAEEHSGQRTPWPASTVADELQAVNLSLPPRDHSRPLNTFIA